MLNKTTGVTTQTQDKESDKIKKWQLIEPCITIAITILFPILKLINIIDWDWVWVLSPLWGMQAIRIIFGLASGIWLAIYAIRNNIR
jgi:hypothetical protein